MIRLFIFVFLRFFITVLAIYLGLTLLRKVIRVLQGYSPPSSNPRKENYQKPKEDYNDVKDAKFTELSDKQAEDKSS